MITEFSYLFSRQFLDMTEMEKDTKKRRNCIVTRPTPKGLRIARNS